MRSFDAKVKEYNIAQYWSALDATSNVVKGQMGTSVSDIVFQRAVNNILPNPTFTANTTGWTGYTFDPDVGHTNLGSARTTASGTIRDMNSQTFAATPGQTYYLEAYVKWTGVSVSGVGSTIGIGITANLADNSKTYPSIQMFANTNTSADQDWVKLSGTWTVPSNVVSFIIRPTVRTVVTTGTIWFDDVVAYRVDAPNQITGNRNIVSDSGSSILLDTSIGTVTAPEFTDFSLGMLIYPEVSDVWAVKFNATITPSGYTNTYSNTYEEAPSPVSIGVKVNSDSTISLIWVVDDELVENKIVFTEQLCYLALTRVAGTVTLQVNDELTSFEGDTDFSFTGFTMGGGSGGTSLVDKIAFATGTGNIPRPLEYFSLFRMQRLDGVARPAGEVGFTYVNDITTPAVITLTSDDFNYEDGYNYGFITGNENSVWEIEKRAGFSIEASLDFGDTWTPLPTKGYIPGAESIIFRHSELTDQSYFIRAKLTGQVSIPLSFFDVTVDGPMYMPEFIGDGYFDVEQARITDAKITITKQNLQIRSVEFLGEINGSGTLLDTTGATVYVNGVPSSLAAMKPNQIYHVVVTWPTGKDFVEINPTNNVSASLAGIGASATPYTQADAYYIFNSFSRNTMVAGLETASSLSDGIAPNAQTPGEPISAVNLQWNS